MNVRPSLSPCPRPRRTNGKVLLSTLSRVLSEFLDLICLLNDFESGTISTILHDAMSLNEIDKSDREVN